MTDRTRRALVLLNRRSGTLAASDTRDEPERIAAGLRAGGVEADVREIEPSRLAEMIRGAPGDGFDAVVIGGGDGTINTAANAAAGLDLAFAVLPLGTHNHFAKEMGFTDDLDESVRALASAIVTDSAEPLDVAEVNGRLFLNFSGVGLHPKLVEQREVDHAQIKQLPLVRQLLRKFTKPLAMIVSFLRSLADLPILRLRIEEDGVSRTRVTPSLIVGNNAHQMEVFGIDDVSVCRRDVLNVYVVRTRRATGLIRLVLAAVFRRLPKLREFEATAARELVIRHRRPTLKVSIDGEVARMKTPLVYRIRQGALRMVRVNRGNEAAVAGMRDVPQRNEE